MRSFSLKSPINKLGDLHLHWHLHYYSEWLIEQTARLKIILLLIINTVSLMLDADSLNFDRIEYNYRRADWISDSSTWLMSGQAVKLIIEAPSLIESASSKSVTAVVNGSTAMCSGRPLARAIETILALLHWTYFFHRHFTFAKYYWTH